MSEKTDFLIIKQIIEATDLYQKELIDYETTKSHLILFPRPGCFADFAYLSIAFRCVGYECHYGHYFNPTHKTIALIVNK